MNIQDILKQAQDVQERVAKIKADLEHQELEASAGGGMVTVKVNGAQVVTSVKIDPLVVDKDDIQMLQDLVKAATNEALKQSKESFKNELTKITGGIPIPGL